MLEKERRRSEPYVQVTFQQGGVDDLQQLFAALNRRRPLHERRRGGGVGVIQLFHQVAAFLCTINILFRHAHKLNSSLFTERSLS